MIRDSPAKQFTISYMGEGVIRSLFPHAHLHERINVQNEYILQQASHRHHFDKRNNACTQEVASLVFEPYKKT